MTSNAIVGQGVTIKRGDGASIESFDLIGEITSFNGPGGSAVVIDTTSVDSSAIEKLIGLPDEGQFSFEMNLVPSDTGQSGLRTDRTNQTLRNFEITLTDSGPTVLTFAAYVMEFTISGAVNDKMNASCTLEISGAVTWA